MLDLKEQLSAYLDHVVQGVDVQAVEKRTAWSHERDDLRPRRGAKPGWVYAVAAAAVVLLVVGVFAWLVGPDSGEFVDTPPTTTVTTIPPEVESGTLDTPVGTASWVHLSSDEDTLPGIRCYSYGDGGGCAGPGVALSWPSGFAIFQRPVTAQPVGSPVLPAQLWVSVDGIKWHVEPLPVPSDSGFAVLSLDDGMYWLISSPGRLWRSTDGSTWDEYDPSGLVPPGPAGLGWRMDYAPPVTVGDLTLSFATFEGWFPFADYVPGFVEDNPCVERFLELEPGVFAMVGDEAGGCPSEPPVLRFEETGTGLQVLDNETGLELGEVLGADLTHIARMAQTDELLDQRLLVIGDGEVTPVEVPWPGIFNSVKLFGAEDWIYAYVQPGSGPMTVWRTSDGRSWTDLGPPNFPDSATPTGYIDVRSLPGLLVATNWDLPAAWETTDGVNWTPLPGGLPEGTYPVRLESGWFANNGSQGGPSDGDAWWMHAGVTWVSLADLGMEKGGFVNTAGVGDTTFFFGSPIGSSPGGLWVLSLDP